mmetsp:Transcript_52635/g.127579  ORF Transcript_52635/g.127579 Transcript_52635/m.127579 type:complete len:991 (+) Transcript_52635:182-3154(+)
MEAVYSRIDDDRKEKLLTEKLLNGFVLLEDFCPACSTPLVKNAESTTTKDESQKRKMGEAEHFLVPNTSFEQPFRPVPGVPVCVVCNSHVITREDDIDLLERCDSLKDKGSILVSPRRSEEEKKEEHEEYNRAVVHEIINLADTPNEDFTFNEEKPQEKSRRAPSPETPRAKTDAAVTVEEEYSVRREVATKVLGTKMLQGYTLQETTCDRCGMPLMEKRGDIECVVCPALAKKAKKRVKAEKKLAETKARLEREIALKKVNDAMKETENKERKLDLEAKKARLLALEKEEEAKIAALEEEEARLLRQAHGEEPDNMTAMTGRTAERLAVERTRQKKEEEALLEETRRLEEIETMTFTTKTEEMQKDLLKHEHRRRVAKKLVLDSEVAKLEEERLQEQLELRRIQEEKKAEVEAKILEELEADAAAKALAAEEAIRKAKMALETVNSTKKEIIAETIALAEKEAIAECEETIKAEREDYKERVILPSESELHNERWDTLRVEGRAILTRRVMKGWELIPESCQGAECEMSPLLMKNGKKECVVCGGCGNGKDGVYASELLGDNKVGQNPEYKFHQPIPSEIEADMPLKSLVVEHEGDFEEKRDLVSKEIGQRMLLGWTLLDASCPKCVMPLMMDNLGNRDICVLHGAVEPHSFDEPTVEETEYQTEAGSQNEAVGAEDLIRTIRERASQQQSVKSASSTKSDPPAFTKINKKKDPQSLKSTTQKSLDFANPSAVQELLGSAAEYDDDDDDMDTNSLTPEMVAKMLMKSPQGHNLVDHEMSFQEAKDLVDIFVAANFEKPLSDGFTSNVTQIIVNNLKDDGVIHLEHIESPGRSPRKNFNFEGFADSHSMSDTSRRSKPNPELTIEARPSMESNSSPTNNFARPPRSPPNRSSPKKHVVVGGPLGKDNGAVSNYHYSHRHSDTGSIGGASRASTVASDALESIYVRIDECKAKLMDPTNSITDQLATADLLEKLANAAVAVRNMEKQEEED